jgi:hypothetical protein
MPVWSRCGLEAAPGGAKPLRSTVGAFPREGVAALPDRGHHCRVAHRARLHRQGDRLPSSSAGHGERRRDERDLVEAAARSPIGNDISRLPTRLQGLARERFITMGREGPPRVSQTMSSGESSGIRLLGRRPSSPVPETLNAGEMRSDAPSVEWQHGQLWRWTAREAIEEKHVFGLLGS